MWWVDGIVMEGGVGDVVGRWNGDGGRGDGDGGRGGRVMEGEVGGAMWRVEGL